MSSSLALSRFLVHLRLETGLLADYVWSNPIKVFVAFDEDYFGSIRVDKVVATIGTLLDSFPSINGPFPQARPDPSGLRAIP